MKCMKTAYKSVPIKSKITSHKIISDKAGLTAKINVTITPTESLRVNSWLHQVFWIDCL